MKTERIEKFVNAIACDLEEGGFRQVSGTMLRRTLATAVSAALPLLADQQEGQHLTAAKGTLLALGYSWNGFQWEAISPPAELAEQQGEGRERFEAWAETILGDNPNWRESGNGELARQAWQAALAALAASRAEVEGLKKDAERYRVMMKKENMRSDSEFSRGCHEFLSAHGFSGDEKIGWDAAIDAAMEKGNV